MAREIRLPNGTILSGVPDDATKAQIQEKAIAAGLANAEDFESPSRLRDIGAGIAGAAGTAVDAASEVAGGFNRGIMDTLDFLGSGTVDAGAQMVGSDFRLPKLRDSGLYPERGAYLGEGAASDILGATGEVAA